VLIPLGGDGVVSERGFSQDAINLAEYDMEVQLAQVSTLDALGKGFPHICQHFRE